MQQTDTPLRVFHNHAFRDFQFDMTRWHAAHFQQPAYLVHEIRIAELSRRDIDGDPGQCGTALIPRLTLIDRGTHHPVSNRNDQAGFFQQGDEFEG